MRMTLQEMRIANFKGIRSLTVTFGSDSTAISGMNGTGKSSIADAFSWVLWNKDSHGNAPGSDNFHEKPLDERGNEIHNLDTTVELLCTLEPREKQIILLRYFRDKTQSEIARQLGVSQVQVSRLESRILKKLRDRCNETPNGEVLTANGTESEEKTKNAFGA